MRQERGEIEPKAAVTNKKFHYSFTRKWKKFAVTHDFSLSESETY